MLIVVSLVLTSFTGILFLSENASSETVFYDGDLTVTGPRNMTNVIMSGNLVIGQGGVVTVDHGSLVFAQSTYTGEQFTLTIEDGGKLILNNATLTTQMDALKAFPSLGVLVRHGGSIEAYDSTLRFSGHMVVDDSDLIMWRSSIEGFEQVVIDQYCNSDNTFPPAVFATSPTLLFVSANVGLYDNSSIEDIYEPQKWEIAEHYLPSMWSHNYDFAVDVNNATGARDSVLYSLNRMPGALDATLTTVPTTQLFENLTTDDTTFYYVGGSEEVWLDGFDTAGAVFNAADGIAPVLNIKYKTDQYFSSAAYIYFQYRNGTPVQTTLQLQNTYDASKGQSVEQVGTVTLPVMSSQDLYGLRIGYANADTDDGVFINKVWASFEFEAQTYKNVTLAGSTDLTVINSYIGVDFSDDIDHNQLVLTDNAQAEMYGVAVDLTQTPFKEADREPAFVTVEKTITVTPWALDTTDALYPDNSTQSLVGLQKIGDDIYDVIGPLENLHISQFNASGLSGPISDIVLSIRYMTGATFTPSYIAWSIDGVNYINTAIAPRASAIFVTDTDATLPLENIDSLEKIGDLDVLYTNQHSTNDLTIDMLWMEVTLRPTVHIYRWAEIAAIDTQALPVEGASITLDPVPMYYASGVAQSTPPAAVLRYLGVDGSTLMQTNALGKALVPVPVDVIYQTSTNPNSRTTATYDIDLTYTKGVDIYTGEGAVSFLNPYPNLNPTFMISSVTILMPGLVLDLPDLYVGTITVVPVPAYDGDGLSITVEFGNQGNTTASNVKVVVICLLNGTEADLNYSATLDVVLSHGTITIPPINWLNVPNGDHVISVTIDPEGSIPEAVSAKANNQKSQAVTVLPNLADLRITSADIEFLDPSPSISYPITTNIRVWNDGRAAAIDALVQIYAGGDKYSGQLVSTATITVGAGSSANITVTWNPDMVGTYPVYVYVNDDRAIEEYDYSLNVAWKSITVTLVTDPSDWIFDGTPANPNLTLPKTSVNFEVRTNITIELNGMLVLDGTKVSLSPESAYALQITVKGDGILILRNAAQLTSNYDIRLYLMDNGQLIVEDSIIQAKLKIQADDTSSIMVDTSAVYADLVTPDTSYATVTAFDSTFSAWSSFGGYAEAELTNVTMPTLKAYGNAVITHYRWVVASVTDGNGKALDGAFVEADNIYKDIVGYSGYTGADGKVVFQALSDVYYADHTEVLGTYLFTASYTYNAVAYPSEQEHYAVSLLSFADAPYSIITTVSIEIPQALPDLSVPTLNIGTLTPLRGQTISVGATFVNDGRAPAFGVTVVFKDNGVVFYSTTIAEVGIGQTAEVSTTWVASYPLGSRNISVAVDPNGLISEVTPKIKVDWVYVNVEGIDELVVERSDVVFTPLDPVVGREASLGVTVHNIGDRARVDAVVSVYARSTVPSSIEVLVAQEEFGSIAAGGSVSLNAVWTPANSGLYDFRIAIDTVDWLTFSQYVKATGYNDWIVDGTTQKPVVADTVLNGNITIMDNGELIIDGKEFMIWQSQDFEMSVFVRDNGKLTIRNGSLFASNFMLAIEVSENGQISVAESMVGPNVLVVLEDSATLLADEAFLMEDLITSSDSSAVVIAVNTTLDGECLFDGATSVDLIGVDAASITVLGAALVDNYRWMTIEVNDANGYDLPNSVVQVYSGYTPSLYGEGVTDELGSITFLGICDYITASSSQYVGGTYSVQAIYTYEEQTFDSGPLTVVGIMDPYVAGEPIVRDDLTKALIIDGARPDLDPPLILSDTTPQRGEIVDVSTTISNLGVVPAYNVLVLFNDTGVTFHSRLISVINPGQEIDIETTWLAWYPLDPAAHTISVIVDPYRTIKEMTTENNYNSTEVYVQGITDLSVVLPDVSLNPYAPVRNDEVEITAFVRNHGDIAASNVKVSFYAQAIAPGAPELLLGEQDINSIGVGGFGEVAVSWHPSMAGDYVIRIAIDGVTTLTFTQEVLNYADLIPTNILFTPASPAVVNTQVVVRATVANIGDIAAHNIVVRFYVGEAGNGVLIGEKIMSLVEAGSSADVTLAWNANITNGELTQNIDITVAVNPQHLIAEIDYTNNNFTQTIRVNEVRPDIFFPDPIWITSSGATVTHASQGATIQISTNVSNSGVTPALGAKIVFYIRDSANKTTVIGTLYKDIGVGEGVNVLSTWAITVGKGNYTIIINANPDNTIDESNATNDQVTITFVVDAPNLGLTINPLGAESYGAGSNIFVSGRAYNIITSDPLPGVAITVYLTQQGERKGANFTATTDQAGNFAMSVYIPDGLAGAVEVNALATNADKSTASATQITVKSLAETGVQWYVYLLILALIAGVIVVFSMYLYKYGLGKMVECGECGALIPDSSRKCPKCGTEFEVGTAKCSECSAWIPSNSTSCPECGAKFLTQAIEEEEDAYLKKMRIQYEIYADSFKDEAKRVMGKKYHDNKFMEWWKKQPSFVSFEDWLSQEENKRKVGGVACPSCGTLNPRGAQICHQCGSVIEVPKAEAASEEPKPEGRKPLRRIVRRPVEKKPAEEVKPEEPKPEENKPQT